MVGSRPTYRKAGVDVSLARRFIRAIEPIARMTRQPGLLKGIGGFGGLFELSGPSSGRVLVASADGVGTKLCLAQRVGWYAPLGVDLVAMNVNDILCTGARPLFFLDYIACGRLNPKVLLEIVRGIARGCAQAGCVLLGGETAQMPLVYGSNEFDLAGFAVGIVDRHRIVSGGQIRVGDEVLGLASSGLHSNGFTLVQRVFSKQELKRWGRELLKPTRIYVKPVLELLKRKVAVRGIAHITGGSFAEKIPRIIPKGLKVAFRKGSWEIPGIFRRIQACGVREAEMFRTFNMGIGMALVVPRGAAARARSFLRSRGLDSWVIGEVQRGGEGVEWAE
ncbi:MAG: phosphoribosylformylglycinamidine cyclo-ligase [Candidatus Omnitrophica bacterium]|nr:phosphoribosylformylglycinamidine cyclo-ligase [Candidatus Omnitrophota bacterium]